ncbi:MAG TPA: hypoxanthine phosphoribosyltransferase [Anaerolineaceae bacterium]
MNRDSLQAYGDLANDIQEIFATEQEIHNRVSAIGAAISRDYAGKDVVLIGVLKGVLCFMADLVRTITIPVEVDFISISGYSAKEPFHGVVRFVKDVEVPVENRHIIFVEDVVDTGLTLNYLLRNLRARNPASLEVCTLFNKPDRRLIEARIKYTGFDLPDFFVVGYGLDHRERYRNLPFVGILKPGALLNKRGPK